VSERVPVELCAGSAALSLWCLGRARPPIPYMGSKAAWAPDLAYWLRCDRPDRVVLVDPGPWGHWWTWAKRPGALADTREAVLSTADWTWEQLVAEGPDGGPLGWARWLRISALEMRNRPVAWDGQAWQCGRDIARPRLGFRAASYLAPKLAAKLALPSLDRVEVVIGDSRALDAIPGASVLLDPPYVKTADKYKHNDFTRSDVIEVARRWAAACCRVAVTEAEPVEIDGWTTRIIPKVGAHIRQYITAYPADTLPLVLL